jgi:hypothetical protein
MTQPRASLNRIRSFVVRRSRTSRKSARCARSRLFTYIGDCARFTTAAGVLAPLIHRLVDVQVPPGLEDLRSSGCHGLLAKRSLPGSGLPPSTHRSSWSRCRPHHGPQ